METEELTSLKYPNTQCLEWDINVRLREETKQRRIEKQWQKKGEERQAKDGLKRHEREKEEEGRIGEERIGKGRKGKGLERNG